LKTQNGRTRRKRGLTKPAHVTQDIEVRDKDGRTFQVDAIVAGDRIFIIDSELAPAVIALCRLLGVFGDSTEAAGDFAHHVARRSR